MFGKKKGFTASQSKRMSRRMNNATIGSHVQRKSASPRRTSRPAAQNTGTSSVSFSNTRRQQRAARGEVDHVVPRTASGESREEYTRRVNQRRFSREIEKKERTKRIVSIAVVALLACLVAVFVGSFVYVQVINSKLSLGDSNASEALVAQNPEEPYYVLCAAELGSAQGSGGAETDTYMLVRIDEANKTAALLSIPGNLQVTLSDGIMHPLYEARDHGGDAELISAVAQFAEVDISHYMTTDIEGLSHIVDVVENVGLTLEEEVDDPEAGNVYLSAGDQVITSEAVPTLLRASNFRGGSEVQTDNRGAFMATLAERLLEKSGLPFVFQLDAIAGSMKTDWSATDIMAVADALRGMKASSVEVALVPGSETEAAGGTVYVASLASSLLERMKAGEALEVQETEVTVDQTKFEIEIRNGAYIDGAGAQMSEILTQAGFKVGDVGNANDGVIYPETLVIYKDPAQAQNAEAVVQALQAGRVINGGDFYTFDTEILVILGEDWQPIL